MQDANNYRYGYQGQFAETDPETGKPAFELRLYDPRINRWLSPDPYGQYASPYVGMGNDWANGVDSDGGWKSKFGAWLWKTFNGGGEIVGEKGNWSVAQTGADGWDTFITNGEFDRDLLTPNLAYAYEPGSGAFAPGHSLLIDLETGLGYEIFHPTIDGKITSGTPYAFSNERRASQYYTWQVFEPGTTTPYTGNDNNNQGFNYWEQGGIDGAKRAPNGLSLEYVYVKNIQNVRKLHFSNVNTGEGWKYISQGVCSTYCLNLIDTGNNKTHFYNEKGALPALGTNPFKNSTHMFRIHLWNKFKGKLILLFLLNSCIRSNDTENYTISI